MFSKILIANRGEIAIRIIRTCQEMGIKTVAIYSDADRISPHVLKADEAYPVGPSESKLSYLNVPRILEVIEESGADAIHPGYGFLSENCDFAETILEKGLTWIGPSIEAIAIMGDKMVARQLAGESDIPIIPGTNKPIKNIEKAIEIATDIGFPVLIKAAGGGGGKGMRIVHNPDEFLSAFERSQSEAKRSFSDDRVYIEKYIEEPHHIEIQILADQHKNIISLGERECSIQRRYQKIIEETPSPFINESTRSQLEKAAINIAISCNYVGAGTVEFLVEKSQNFYFLEMNTRLQVEHPITEMVAGIDLVKAQIEVALGKQLSEIYSTQNRIGHAIECRIYAEDGFNNFTPSTGKIHELIIPGGLGIRFDDGIIQGQDITPYYDPLLGKLIAIGENRETALARMTRALSEFHIAGIKTNIPFCKQLIQHPLFQKGKYHTDSLKEWQNDLTQNLIPSSDNIKMIAAIGAIINTLQNKPKSLIKEKSSISNWRNNGLEDAVS